MEVILPEVFDFMFEDARYKGAHGGRGSGKSWAFATTMLVRCAQRSTRALCGREFQKSIKDSVKALLDQRIFELGMGHLFSSQESVIHGPHGGRITFAGLRTNPDSVQSAEGLDVAWIEEAQRLSKRSLGKLTPTVRRPGSELWFSWNPDSPTDPVDELLRSEQSVPPRYLIREVNYYDNPFFPEELRQDMEEDKRRDAERYAHVWLGKYWSRSDARVFHNWTVDHCPDPPAKVRLYFGADWGFSIDPTVLVRCWIDPEQPRRLYVDREAWQVGCEIDQTPALFDQVEDGQARRWPLIADSARPETISYMRKHGYPHIVGATKGAGSVEDGVEFLRSFDLVVDPRCRHVVDELTHYRYKVDLHTDQVLPILEDKKNHTIDALRYAVEATRRAVSRLPGVAAGLTRESPNKA